MTKLPLEEEIVRNWDGESPLVTIICTSYNHEKFIDEALRGFLAQKTSFPFRILVHDDASSDKTARIISTYASAYPKIIKPILQEKNLFSQGIPKRPYLLPYIEGEYIALCEGDDYWIDPHKLQVQVDAFRQDASLTLCFTGARTRIGSVISEECMVEDALGRKLSSDQYFSIEDLIKRNFIPTASVMFRREHFSERPSWSKGIGFGDWIRFVQLAELGKVLYLHRVSSIYRLHEGGMWSKKNHQQRFEEVTKFYKAYAKHKSSITVSEHVVDALSDWLMWYAKTVDIMQSKESRRPLFFRLIRGDVDFIAVFFNKLRTFKRRGG